jgi:hypothetical protein
MSDRFQPFEPCPACDTSLEENYVAVSVDAIADGLLRMEIHTTGDDGHVACHCFWLNAEDAAVLAVVVQQASLRSLSPEFQPRAEPSPTGTVSHPKTHGDMAGSNE